VADRKARIAATSVVAQIALGHDADTGRIVATELTGHDIDDGSQFDPLLEGIDGPVASFTGDGAYDRDDVYDAVAARHSDADVIVPPRANAVPSATAETPGRGSTSVAAGC
jgi:hypothetical protein